ncbi:glycosyltransferase family 32 protein [Candidatus Dependentiae bacterium]
MKKIVNLLLIVSLFVLPSCFFNNKSKYQDVNQFKSLAKGLYVDFDTSMQTERYANKIANKNVSLLSIFKQKYDFVNLYNVTPQMICKIPKVFHYIWFGVKLPDQYKPFLETWLKYHPNWTFVFWVDNPQNYDLGNHFEGFTFADLKRYLQSSNPQKEKRIVIDVKNINFDNRTFFDQTRNYGQRSDILKWEVVYRFGGVYIDVDFECIKPLDMLNHMYDFYTGIQPLDTSFIQLGAALFAARPGHPTLKHCVESIKDDWHNPQVVVATGPLHFTKSYFQTLSNKGLVDAVFPASYFYPCGYDEQKLPRKNWIKPESFAVHHWAGSWLKPEGWDKTTTT